LPELTAAPSPDLFFETLPAMPATFAMQMLAGTPAGDAYTFRELREMLEAAGFAQVAAHPLQGPQTVVVGTK
jgi:hypothetical protein